MFSFIKKLVFELIPWKFKLFKECSFGKKFKTGMFVNIENNKVTIGDFVYIGQFSYIGPSTNIGNFCMIADLVNIIGSDHNFDRVGVPIILAGRPNEEVKTVIEDDVWIGHGVSIMRGVTIGEGAIVGANSVVTKDVEPYAIVAGIPAKKIKMRLNDNDIITHKKALEQYRTTGILYAKS